MFHVTVFNVCIVYYVLLLGGGYYGKIMFKL